MNDINGKLTPKYERNLKDHVGQMSSGRNKIKNKISKEKEIKKEGNIEYFKFKTKEKLVF
jgi:hypothetical protein